MSYHNMSYMFNSTGQSTPMPGLDLNTAFNSLIRITTLKGLHFRVTGHMDSKPADFGIEIYNYSGTISIQSLGTDLFEVINNAIITLQAL